MKPLRHGGRIVALVTLLILFGLPASARAQDEPVVVGKQEKLPPFGLTRPSVAFNFLGQYSHDSSKSNTAAETQTNETNFEETLSLDTTAYYIHPNFLNIPFHGEFGLRQETFDSESTDDRRNSILYLWDTEAQFFREQPLNFSLYTRRSEDIVDQAFAESFRSIYTVYGGVLTTRNKFPTILRVYREEQRQVTLGGTDDFSLNDNVLEWHTDTIPAPNQTLNWDYRLNQTDQQSQSGVSDSSTGQSATLGHTIAFGPGNAYTLNSTGIYSDTTGNFATERFHLDERLKLRHSPKFETEYEYIFDQQNTLGVDRTLQRGTAKLRHQLYESLHTNAQIGILQLDADSASQTRDIFSTLDFEYTKKVPHGEFHGNLDLGYSYRTMSESSSPVAVVDQPGFFSGFEPIIIPGQTIDPNSLFITSPKGQIYVEGVDYTVTPRPDGVRIDRIIGGAIPADSAVLMDYTLLPVPDTDIRTSSLGLSFRYDILDGPLKGLSPYIRMAFIDQNVQGGGGIIEPASVRGYIAGADYRIWDLTLTGEYEWYDSTLVPFDAVRFIAQLNHRISGDTLVTGYASYVHTDYTSLDQQNTTFNGTVTVTHFLTRNLLISAGLNWVDLDDSVTGHTQGLQEIIDLRWHNRQLDVFARIRNANRTTDDEDTSFQFFELGLRREF